MTYFDNVWLFLGSLAPEALCILLLAATMVGSSKWRDTLINADLVTRRKYEDANNIGTVAVILVILGLYAVARTIWSVTGTDASGGGLERMYVLLLAALTSLVVGAFLGFLFGIPKVLTSEGSKETKTEPSQPGQEGGTKIAYRQLPNSNLEQISDWLTKIIVGISLVESRKILLKLNAIGEQIDSDVPHLPGGASFGIALVVFFGTTGFMGNYLMTRLFLAGAFRDADGQSTLPWSLENAGVTLAERRIVNTSPMVPQDNLRAVQDVDATEKILSQPLGKLSKPEDIVLWARAKVQRGGNAKDFQTAKEAYEKALPYLPDDLSARLGYIIALDKISAPLQEIRRQLDAAYQLADTPGTHSETVRDLYDVLTYYWLYAEPPEGFTKSIQYGMEYTGNQLRLPSPSIWINLACAYGQQYTWLSEDPARVLSGKNNAEAKGAARDSTLEAIRRAIVIEPGAQTRLQHLLQRDGASRSLGDDDLKSFWDDEEFLEVVGLKKAD